MKMENISFKGIVKSMFKVTPSKLRAVSLTMSDGEFSCLRKHVDI